MQVDDTPKLAEGTVTLKRGVNIYIAQWATTGNRLICYLGLDEESAPLGMFASEPETLARILLSELITRQLAK
jgi:hypothetical protein